MKFMGKQSKLGIIPVMLGALCIFFALVSLMGYVGLSEAAEAREAREPYNRDDLFCGHLGIVGDNECLDILELHRR